MTNPIHATVALAAGPWPVLDPFLFCVHHDDAYPAGDGGFAPAVSLTGRALGSDFSRRDGWSLYHGHPVPGFPAHPHRGFETITIVRRGRVDHADSTGAAARYGDGDVQWLTAGRGIVHAEMFPLLDTAAPNPLDLFQIWLNLPSSRKLCEPRFVMFWGEEIPRVEVDGAVLTCIAGFPTGFTPSSVLLAPPPDSWAAQDPADVAVWTLQMQRGTTFVLPPAAGPATRRVLYAVQPGGARVAGQPLAGPTALDLDATRSVAIESGAEPSDWLLLQGRPIGEPVAQHGPFVMNTRGELEQAYADYQRTRFGGWPWPGEAPVHGADPGRFARVGGTERRPGA